MWLSLILRNWQIVVIASLVAALMLSMSLGRMWKAERDAKIAVIDSMKAAAQAYGTRSKEIADETGNAFTVLVEQIKDKDTAIKNARSRFQTCNAAHGVRADWVQPMPSDTGETDVPEGTDGDAEHERVAVDREFIDGAATCAAFVKLTKEWVVREGLRVE